MVCADLQWDWHARITSCHRAGSLISRAKGGVYSVKGRSNVIAPQHLSVDIRGSRRVMEVRQYVGLSS